MILRNATIKYKGYDPEDLKPKSKKRVCVSCDKCGRVRWVSKSDSHHLCKVCGMKGKLVGKNNPNYKSKITLTCQQCGKEYQVKQSKKSSRFCSQECYGKWKSQNQSGKNSPVYGIHRYGEDAPNWKSRITLICQYCGKNFEVIPSHKNRKFCSNKCKGGWLSENSTSRKMKIVLVCQHCGDEYQVKQSKKLISKFCCKKCKDEWKSIHNCGSNHPNWKGGISNLDQPHLISINQCIKLNTKIDGFDAHHIMKGVIIYLPHKLHSINWHDLKNNKNMNKINELALNYLMGEIL